MKFSIEKEDLPAILELQKGCLKVAIEDEGDFVVIDIVPELAFFVGKACGIHQSKLEVEESIKSFKI